MVEAVLVVVLNAHIAQVQAAGGLVLAQTNDDFARFAGGDGVALGVYDVHVKEGRGLAHGADLRGHAHQIADGQGGFGLTKALHEGKTGGLLELIEHLGVQRFPGHGGVVDGGKVVFAQVLLDQHAQHGGRRAEGGDIVLLEQGQNFLRVEAVKVIGEHGGLAQPLAVQLAPQGLAPAGVRNGQVQLARLHAVPVFRGDKVAHGVGVGVGHQLGIAGGAAGKEHHHGVLAAGGVLGAVKVGGEHGILAVKIVPAFPRAAAEDQGFHGGAGLQGLFHVLRRLAVSGAQDGGYLRLVEAVFVIVGQQLIRGGDGDGADFAQGHHADPEVILTAQHHHHLIALFDAQGTEIIGRPGGLLLYIQEGEAPLPLVFVQMKHGQGFGLLCGQSVHHVEGKIEGIQVLEGNGLQGPCFVLHRLGELFINEMLVGGQAIGLDGFHHLMLFHFLAGQDHGQEHAVRAFGGDHAVGGGGIVINGIALAQQLHIMAHLHLQRAGQDIVKFLAGVGGGVDGLVLQFGIEGVAHEIRLRNLLAEHGGQVADINALLLGRHLRRTLAGDGVGGQLSAAALHQVDHIHLEGEGALVQEGKGQVLPRVFVIQVLGFRYVRHPGHFRRRVAADFPQLADTGRHLAHLIGDMLGMCNVHGCFLAFV